jgi:glutamate formiminotransferase/formiminotetrahydrofolate cyclodeaminase
VECVPNVSEGRDPGRIEALAAAVRAVEGARLIHVDPGAATHRTVYTFVGPPAAVLEAAFRLFERAADLIDMRHHHGAHPRMGAVDVCPFVPIGATPMALCVDLARRLGERVGRELGIPVYLYEAAATRPQRASLADIRAGEYEGLAHKLRDPDWAPDFGPAQLNPKSGASVIGARPLLVAYNVNLNTRDQKLAHDIALSVRESGRLRRDPEGRVLRDAGGAPLRLPGRLQGVRAVGWTIPEYGRAQVSLNLTDLRSAGLADVFEAVVEEAALRGLRATGSEIVGLVPLDALLDAGRFYLRRQGRSAAVPERELIHVAGLSLGLAELGPFEPRLKIIELAVAAPAPWGEASLTSFADALSMDAPTPGGGCAAALAGALAAGLAAMGAALAHAKKSAAPERLESIGRRAQDLKRELLAAVDRDARAFDAVVQARRLPRRTDEDRALRESRIAAAYLEATLVPQSVLQRVRELIEIFQDVVETVPPSAASDAAVGLALARAAAEGAALNVRINLGGLGDELERKRLESDSTDLMAAVLVEVERLRARLEQRLGR